MRHKPTVVVLMGGPDAEREVSLTSGRQVAQALRERGRYVVAERVIDRPSAAELPLDGADVVFPVLHGPFGEGGPLQSRLERRGVPYVGSQPAAAALAMDKLASKDLVAAAGVQTPVACRLEPGAPCPIRPPLVLKPNADGSSVDLMICRDEAEVAAARSRLHARRGAVLAERYVSGREITAGVVLGGALPLIEIRPATAFYDYQAKYHRADTRYTIDPEMQPGVSEACTAAALAAFDRLGCRDIARADFIVDAQGPWFLEINTMPGFTTHSLVPMAAASLGMDMPALCGALVDAALARGTPCAAAGGVAAPALAPVVLAP